MTRLLSSQTAARAWSPCYFQWSLASLVVLMGSVPLRADLAEDYLAGLRKRGWHDTALEYLEQASEDPLADADFLGRIGFERASTLATLSRESVDENKQAQFIASAVESFQQFAATQTNSPLQLQALATAGNLLAERAISASNKADTLPKAAQRQRERLYTTAREALDRASQLLQTLLASCEAKLKSLPKATTGEANSAARKTRQRLESKQAEAKFLLAKIEFEKSRTYAVESKARQRSLESAAKAFAGIHEKYEDKLVGFYGRFYQGRSFQAIDDFEQALDCYADIVDQPPIPNQDFRRLVARTYRRRAECHMADNEPDQAIKECRQWLDESRGQELTQPEWLAVSYQLAQAYEKKSATVGSAEARKLEKAAQTLYRDLARNAGEYQRLAKAKISSDTVASQKVLTPKTFAEAFGAAKEALQQMNSSQLAQRLAVDNNPGSVDALTAEVDAARDAASRYFEQALELADDTTDREQLATARYYLCWFRWEEERFDEVAKLGIVLAKNFSESKYAPAAAKLALAAQERLYNAARRAGESADEESRRLTEVAELLATRWPDSPEAATGLGLLIRIAITEDRLSDAEQLLERLPKSDRAAAELKLGGSLWTRYLRKSREEGPATSSTTLALKQQAGEHLSHGYEAIKESPQVTTAEATGLLYFSQWLLASGEAKQAIAVLENSAVGPLALVQQNSPATRQRAFVEETYKVALRAYVSAQPPQRTQAQAIMASLESSYGSSKEAQQKLLNTYVSLGLQLQQQISTLTADGQTEKATAVATAFEDLLSRVNERAGAADSWKVQNWIAQTNLQLGQGLQGDDADRYFEQAAKAYGALVKKAEQDPKFAPSPLSLLATKKRLGDSLQAQGEYSEAFQQYTLILKQKPNMLELQQAAAAALQQWGTDDQDSKRLEESIRGALPQANKKNLVWGWLRLAAIADQARRNAEKLAEGNPAQAARAQKYESLYFEARLRAAEARFAAAKLAQGANRDKQLATARQSLQAMQRLYPELGGPRWQGAYQALLKKMEQLP